MKILFISADLCDGGAQRVMSVLSKEMAQRGHDTHMLVFYKTSHDYRIDPHVKLEIMCEDYGLYKRWTGLRRAIYIRRYLKRIRPDIAIGFLQAGYALYLASFGMHFLKVASLRNSPEKLKRQRGLKAVLERRWFLAADTVVLQTLEQKNYADRKGWHNTVVIPNPVSENIKRNPEYNCAKQCKRIVMAGRLHGQKNYPMALKAFQIVRKRYKDITLSIYGVGTLKDDLQSMICSMGLADCVKLCGWSDNLVAEYRKYDLYLLTSDYEGMPNSLMEAMGAGLPCIATDCPTGPADLIEHGKSGFLVPMNDEGKLSETIIYVMEMDRERRKQIGDCASQFILREFNRSRIARMWEVHLEKMLAALFKTGGIDEGNKSC